MSRQGLPPLPQSWAMRALVGLAAVLLVSALAGCVAGSADKYFPPASQLPDGLVPVPTDTPEWKLVAPVLGMTGNPGRMTALETLPQKDLGQVSSVEAYLLQSGAATPGNGTKASYGILVLAFRSGSDVGAKLDAASACDGKDMAHVLRDGLTYILVSGDGGNAAGKQVLGDLAGAVQARSGATVVC
jgi:hypothetical protein